MKRYLILAILLITTQAQAFGLWGDAGGGFGGGSSPSSITDMFNGFNRVTGDSYTGGPTVIADNTGTLITPPVNRMGIEGARFTDSVWYPTASNGSQLWTAQQLRTRKGSVAKYASTFKGWLNEPARTNKVTCRKHNPIDTTNITTSGGATVTTELDTTEIAAAGLGQICTSGRVYKAVFDGTSPGFVLFAGASGNTNIHSSSITARVVGIVGVPVEFGLQTTTRPILTSATYARVKQENIAPSSSSTQVIIYKPSGTGTVYFILPQLEEGAFATSAIPGDTLATVTRPATNYTRPANNTLRSNSFAIWQRVVPSATGQATVDLWSARSDANNLLEIYMNATQVRLYKVVGGSFAGPIATYTHAANTPFEVQAYQHTSGMGIRVKQDGGSWSAWSETTDATSLLNIVVPSAYQVGAMNNAAHFTGNIPFTSVIQHSDPKGELTRLANQYP